MTSTNEGEFGPEKPNRPRASKTPPVDTSELLRDLLRNADLSRSWMTDEERSTKTRIAEEDAIDERSEKKANADHRRSIELICLWAVIVIAAIVCPICLRQLIDQSVPPERKMWASSLLTLIVGGFLGFMTGRLPGRPQDN